MREIFFLSFRKQDTEDTGQSYIEEYNRAESSAPFSITVLLKHSLARSQIVPFTGLKWVGFVERSNSEQIGTAHQVYENYCVVFF